MGVSTQAIFERAYRLCLASSDERRRFHQTLNARRWRVEPYSDHIPEEKPRFARHLVDALLARGLSHADVAEMAAGALAVLDAEENAPGANIRSFGDALWWAVVTITTVGYGDRYPVTVLGRFVAVGLMVGGVAVIGVVTASVASWLVEQVRTTTAKEVQAPDTGLEAKVTALTELLRRQEGRRDDDVAV